MNTTDTAASSPEARRETMLAKVQAKGYAKRPDVARGTGAA
ncbi:hypothetical protein [Saccharomonospora saliphila]|nr:hypothetical protein [Saccharomonospora saliphila]